MRAEAYCRLISRAHVVALSAPLFAQPPCRCQPATLFELTMPLSFSRCAPSCCARLFTPLFYDVADSFRRFCALRDIARSFAATCDIAADGDFRDTPPMFCRFERHMPICHMPLAMRARLRHIMICVRRAAAIRMRGAIHICCARYAYVIFRLRAPPAIDAAATVADAIDAMFGTTLMAF